VNPAGSVGQDALRRLDEFLAEHENLRVVREPGSITVQGTEETGFDVQMVDDGREATIFAGGWHGHFDDAERAAATFMWLLTPQTRIVLTFRGDSQIGWKLQWEEDGKWVTGERGAILLAFLFWGRRREEILQNHLL
jgi:hypothetical protein